MGNSHTIIINKINDTNWIRPAITTLGKASFLFNFLHQIKTTLHQQHLKLPSMRPFSSSNPLLFNKIKSLAQQMFKTEMKLNFLI